jgi:hypothetical protein
MSHGNESLRELIGTLRREAARIRELEHQAEKSLHEREDKTEHKRLMTRKAEILAALPDTAAPFLEGIAEPVSDHIRRTLAGFSQRARTALKLDSVFFMTMLLYPEDYREGESNDLEAAVSDWERRLAG